MHQRWGRAVEIEWWKRIYFFENFICEKWLKNVITRYACKRCVCALPNRIRLEGTSFALNGKPYILKSIYTNIVCTIKKNVFTLYDVYSYVVFVFFFFLLSGTSYTKSVSCILPSHFSNIRFLNYNHKTNPVYVKWCGISLYSTNVTTLHNRIIKKNSWRNFPTFPRSLHFSVFGCVNNF